MNTITNRLPLLFLVLFLIAGLLAAIPARAAETPMYVHGIDVTTPDNNHGDSFYIELPDGKKMLIDSGGADGGIIQKLQSRGVTRLDYVLGTHHHGDHIGAMDDIINTFEVGALYYSSLSPTDGVPYQNMKAAADAKGLTIQKVVKGQYIFNTTANSKQLFAIVLAPISTSKIYSDSNNTSVVLKLKYGNRDMLFMGDGGKALENDLLAAVPERLPSDILKIGHHAQIYTGIEDICTPAFLDKVIPNKAIATTAGNESIEEPIKTRLRDRNIEYWHTRVNGDVTFQTYGTTSWSCNEPSAWPDMFGS